MTSEPKRFRFPIPIDGAPDTHFAGFLYESAPSSRRNVLQVAAHGTSYDHRYWDAGVINGNDYSYVRFMNQHGFDVLALDLPGVGASDAPPDGAFTVRAVGHALSSLINSLRGSDAVLGREFERVISIGHSLGSTIGVFAEANWPAADALIVTATGHYPLRPKNSWKPGQREALFADPYALVPPELRFKFYYQPQADPEVIAFDNETLRTRIPSQLWSDCVDLSNDPVAAGVADVKCPVYIQLGEHDSTLPARYADEERACYKSAAEVIVDPLSDIGHDFNLHLNRASSWQGILAYLSRP